MTIIRRKKHHSGPATFARFTARGIGVALLVGVSVLSAGSENASEGPLIVPTVLGLRLEGSGTLNANEVVFVSRNLPLNPGIDEDRPSDCSVYAVERHSGNLKKVLFDQEIGKDVYGADKQFVFFGVDNAGRVYTYVNSSALWIVDGGQVARKVNSTPVDTVAGGMVYDDGIVAGCRYHLNQLRLEGEPSDILNLENINWQWALPIDTTFDPPGANISVSPDGELMYVGSTWEAWVWDNHGNLRYVLGLVNPQLSLSSEEAEKYEGLFRRIPGVFVGYAPAGYFDNFHRLWVYYNGYMTSLNDKGQHVTDGFHLPGKGKELVEPDGRWVFSRSDNHMFVLNKKDGLVYEYDLSPTLERKRDENNGLLYAAGKPPVLVRSFALKLPK